jgi:hypothetical protein
MRLCLCFISVEFFYSVLFSLFVPSGAEDETSPEFCVIIMTMLLYFIFFFHVNGVLFNAFIFFYVPPFIPD